MDVQDNLLQSNIENGASLKGNPDDFDEYVGDDDEMSKSEWVSFVESEFQEGADAKIIRMKTGEYYQELCQYDMKVHKRNQPSFTRNIDEAMKDGNEGDNDLENDTSRQYEHLINQFKYFAQEKQEIIIYKLLGITQNIIGETPFPVELEEEDDDDDDGQEEEGEGEIELKQSSANDGIADMSELVVDQNEDNEGFKKGGINTRLAQKLLMTLSPCVSIYFLHAIPSKRLGKMFGKVFNQQLEEVKKFPFESVGQIMTNAYIAVNADWTVQRTLKYVEFRLKFMRSFTKPTTIYVTQALTWKHMGTVEICNLLTASKNSRIRDIMDSRKISISALEDRENAIMVLNFYKVLDIAVIDKSGRLISTVSIQKAMAVMVEETTEDMHYKAAIIPLKQPYGKVQLLLLFLKRVFWLAILVVFNLLSSTVIATFEHQLEENIALAFFIPLLIDTGGNTGSQASTLIIRALVTKEIKLRDFPKTMIKEAFVSLLMGVSLGILAYGVGWIRGAGNVAAVVAVTMFIIIQLSNLAGVLLPFIFTVIRLDPSVAAGPLITTLLDTLGLLVYFGVAALIIDVIGYQ